MSNADTKPGWKTSEVTLATLAGGSIFYIAEATYSEWTKVAACVGLAAIAIVYLTCRTKAKNGG